MAEDPKLQLETVISNLKMHSHDRFGTVCAESVLFVEEKNVNQLLLVPDIQERYQVSAPTARKIMRNMLHLEYPKLAVKEQDLLARENEMIMEPKKKTKRLSYRKGNDDPIPYRGKN
ncbi:MAG: hypothetical protein II481_05680 [Clostridia bacterium]|nr:hypothetical protein [Clostridia bacterium]